MSEREALAVADALGGVPEHTGGGVWVVKRQRADGSCVVLSPGEVAVYARDEDWRAGRSSSRIVWD
jgi:hypothetical protein